MPHPIILGWSTLDSGQCFCCWGRWWRAVLNPNLNLNLNRFHSSGTRTRTRCLVNLAPRECSVDSIHTASTPKLWARIGRGPVLLDFARKSPQTVWITWIHKICLRVTLYQGHYPPGQEYSGKQGNLRPHHGTARRSGTCAKVLEIGFGRKILLGGFPI